ncbi:pentatricopeptide repeat-containing protein At2g22070-like [Aristolochia californica]|uniref:pentatricopeptide repeat-containing protein At2g22070-like n=1 Tax=Aristolochia californica TaxID=171875 RepID=UPI0035DC2CA8
MKARQKLREAVDLLYARGPACSKTYYSLISECIQCSDVEQAKRLQSHMDLYFFQPTTTSLHNRLLHVYGKCNKISYARQLFDNMPVRDVLSYNAMLTAYSKVGLVEEARTLFSQIVSPDSVSFNILISALVTKGFSEDALKYFIQMRRERIAPTEYTHVSVLNVCSHLMDLRSGKEVHGWILTGSSKSNLFVCNALIDMYAKCGDIDQAQRVFNEMIDRNVVSWNSMIAGYLRNGKPDKCLDLFSKMCCLGITPDLVTLSSILRVYIHVGHIEEAQNIFREIKERDVVAWTTMIVGLAQRGRDEDALQLFGEMLLEGIRPDSCTLSSVISACAGLASTDHGKAIHGKAILIGTEGDLLVSTALVDMYSKCGQVRDSWVIFTNMESPNVISWNSMIIGYAQNGMATDALILYERMLKENLNPDNITFVGVLSACCHASFIEQGRKYFHSIREQHGLTPSADHYACMINLLGRSKNMNEVVDLIKNMQIEPNYLIWSTFLSVCRMNGDIEHAEMAARQLFQLDPLDSGPYIMLSNMYAACGRWEDVASMRSLMKERNVRKFAAYSWIEINNKVHKFLSDDRSHPQTKKIYEKLSSLMVKLGEEGYVPDTNLVLHDVGEKEKVESIYYHSEKLALAYGLISKPQNIPLRIVKNIRVCGDCHLFMKFVSKATDRYIILRDSNRYHHFVKGQCSCKDYW